MPMGNRPCACDPEDHRTKFPIPWFNEPEELGNEQAIANWYCQGWGGGDFYNCPDPKVGLTKMIREGVDPTECQRRYEAFLMGKADRKGDSDE